MLFLSAVLAMTVVPDGVIHHGDSTLTAAEMLEYLQKTDVIFIGEKHDDPLAHEWELFIWQALSADGRALALEMFETDVQEYLDDYLAGEISEQEFLEASRPWGNYTGDYAPIVEFAHENGNRVIAANVPRTYAAMVARGGWESLSGETFFEELDVDSTNALYHEMFIATMDALGGGMGGMPMNPEDMYKAQLLKDAIMAASISTERCVFICGSFHSDYHSGIPDQLESGRDYITVSILTEGEEYSPEIADFVIVPPVVSD